MEDWIERLIKEQSELKDKFVKLVNFVNTPEFFSLSDNNRKLLTNQKIAMELYLNILNMRLYENVDKIVVPDYGFMGLFGGMLGNSFGFPKSDGVKKLESELNNKQ